VFFISLFEVICVGDLGTILKSNDMGITWSSRTTGTLDSLRSVYFPDSLTGYATGVHGVIFKTTNGGETWFAVTGITTGQLTSVFFTNNNTGYVTGGDPVSGGIISKTTDGGINWRYVNPPNITMLNATFFTDATTGYIAGYGGTIMKTTNGGTGISGPGADAGKMIVYPVPARDLLNVVLPENISLKNAVFSIYDIHGRLKLGQDVISHSTKLSLSSLSSGIYIIRFSNGAETLSSKIIRP